jgi:hypothetical protein
MIPGPGLSPLMMAMMALDNPDMLARRMAELGREPPKNPPLTTPSMQPQVNQMLPLPMGPLIPPQAHGSTAKPLDRNEALPAMGDVPTPPVIPPAINLGQAIGGPVAIGGPGTMEGFPAPGPVTTETPSFPNDPAIGGPNTMAGFEPQPQGSTGMDLWPFDVPFLTIGGQTLGQMLGQMLGGPTPAPVPTEVPPVMAGTEAPGAAAAPTQPAVPPAVPPAVKTPPAVVNPSQAVATGLSPMPAPTPIAPHPASTPVPAQAPATGPVTAAAGMTPGAPNPAMNDLMTAMAGVQAAAGDGAGGRVPNAPAPYIQGALNPQTAEILKQVLANPNLVGSLGSFMR